MLCFQNNVCVLKHVETTAQLLEFSVQVFDKLLHCSFRNTNFEVTNGNIGRLRVLALSKVRFKFRTLTRDINRIGLSPRGSRS
jgi:hypothetical protein